MIATHAAQESKFAGLIRLVEEAQQSKAPMSRLADRWSLGFLFVTVTIAFAAWWMTGDPIRAVAVLVVATPCPLILAVPVPLVAGLSRAAHFGVLIKRAASLEKMARIRTSILDKTGTLTDGPPQIVSIVSLDGREKNEVLGRAAALEQASKHPVAQAIVAAAHKLGSILPVPCEVTEVPGDGLIGRVEDHAVIVGGYDFVANLVGRNAGRYPALSAGSVLVAIAVDGKIAGYLVLADKLREGASDTLSELRQHGIRRMLLATGDRADVVGHVTQGLGFSELHSALTPDQKVKLVVTERKKGTVMMVGDGVNDAPALAIADVGVAMGSRGAAASVDAVDVVLLVVRLDPLCTGIEIAEGARRIALESVVVGIGLSVLDMIAAAYGYITPVQGAFLQELVDVAVIVNALRLLRIRSERPDRAGSTD